MSSSDLSSFPEPDRLQTLHFSALCPFSLVFMNVSCSYKEGLVARPTGGHTWPNGHTGILGHVHFVEKQTLLVKSCYNDYPAAVNSNYCSDKGIPHWPFWSLFAMNSYCWLPKLLLSVSSFFLLDFNNDGCALWDKILHSLPWNYSHFRGLTAQFGRIILKSYGHSVERYLIDTM